eukprot:scaffold160_cov157-Skeletonema_menzelii.AAC.37
MPSSPLVLNDGEVVGFALSFPAVFDTRAPPIDMPPDLLPLSCGCPGRGARMPSPVRSSFGHSMKKAGIRLP